VSVCADEKWFDISSDKHEQFGIVPCVNSDHQPGIASYVSSDHQPGIASYVSSDHQPGIASYVGSGHQPGIASYVGSGHQPGIASYVNSDHQPGIASYVSSDHQPGIASYVSSDHQPGIASYVNSDHQPGIASYVNSDHQPGIASYVGSGHQPGIASYIDCDDELRIVSYVGCDDKFGIVPCVGSDINFGIVPWVGSDNELGIVPNVGGDDQLGIVPCIGCDDKFDIGSCVGSDDQLSVGSCFSSEEQFRTVPHLLTQMVDAASQAHLYVESHSVQCDILPYRVTTSEAATQYEPEELCLSDDEYEMSNSDEESDQDNDPDWHLSAEEHSEDSSTCDDDGSVSFDELLCDKKEPYKEKKFLVFESCLRELLLLCFICQGHCSVYLKRIFGTMVVLQQRCVNGHTRIWSSQPSHGNMPYGNLATAACLFFNGCSPVKFLNICHHLGMPMIKLRTFYLMQSSYLIPAVKSVWNSSQQKLLQSLAGKNCIVGGDARCCSPGHTAKFSSYTVMDLESSKILDVKLVQVNEVKNSNAMELEGLKRCLAFLSNFINILSITTDRHTMVKKFLASSMQHIKHWFDVWHVAKNIKKKIDAKANRKDCSALRDWSHSVSNHLYWCAASSAGCGDLVVEKWQSILRHVVDVHFDHGNLFPQCEHGPLEPRLWLQSGSRAHQELTSIVSNKLLCRDIKSLSPAEQTSSLESYHKIVTFFAPKSVHFFYPAMEARIFISALHFNENSNRPQATDQNGESRWAVSYPKARRGEAVVKQVKVAPTYAYVSTLLDSVFNVRDAHSSYAKAASAVCSLNMEIPLPVASKNIKTEKMQLVHDHKKRFNK